MKLSKVAKRVLSLALAVAVTASSVAVMPTSKKAEAASSYKAYLCMATGKWTFRNEHNDSKFSNKLQNTTNKLSSKASKAKFKDTTMKKGTKTYSVSLTGLKKGVISNDGTFNTLYVDTSIKGSLKKKVSIKNVKVYFDGKLVKTFKKGILTPDPGKTANFVQLHIINTWNSRVPKFKYSMPKSSIKITYTATIK